MAKTVRINSPRDIPGHGVGMQLLTFSDHSGRAYTGPDGTKYIFIRDENGEAGRAYRGEGGGGVKAKVEPMSESPQQGKGLIDMVRANYQGQNSQAKPLQGEVFVASTRQADVYSIHEQMSLGARKDAQLINAAVNAMDNLVEKRSAELKAVIASLDKFAAEHAQQNRDAISAVGSGALSYTHREESSFSDSSSATVTASLTRSGMEGNVERSRAAVLMGRVTSPAKAEIVSPGGFEGVRATFRAWREQIFGSSTVANSVQSSHSESTRYGVAPGAKMDLPESKMDVHYHKGAESVAASTARYYGSGQEAHFTGEGVSIGQASGSDGGESTGIVITTGDTTMDMKVTDGGVRVSGGERLR